MQIPAVVDGNKILQAKRLFGYNLDSQPASSAFGLLFSFPILLLHGRKRDRWRIMVGYDDFQFSKEKTDSVDGAICRKETLLELPMKTKSRNHQRPLGDGDIAGAEVFEF